MPDACEGEPDGPQEVLRQRNFRDQLEHVLNCLAGLAHFRIHHPMYVGLLRSHLTPGVLRYRLILVRTSAIPGATNIISGDGLDETASFNVANFDESAVKEQDVGRMPGNPLRCAFPLDCTHMTAWVSMFVDIYPELWGCRQIVPHSGPSVNTVPS